MMILPFLSLEESSIVRTPQRGASSVAVTALACRLAGASRRAGLGRCRLPASGWRVSRRRGQERHFGATYDRAFRGVTEPDPEVLEKARYQPEFTAPVWDYFDNRVHEQSVAVGRQMARKWKPWLDRIEQRYGVDRNILLAIWSMESNYGEILKNDEGDAQRRALAGDARLCRQAPREIRAHPADRRAQDPADAATSTRAT